jgi:hypothetical protein
MDQRQPGTHGTGGVIVARTRNAEYGHRGVADELLQPAAVASDGLAHRREVAVLDERDVLGIEALG